MPKAKGRDKEKILWNVPFQRNPFFTGREDLLTHLHKVLNKDNAAALTQAISGLGGVGKTQTAIEYAYRHRDNYRLQRYQTQRAKLLKRRGGLVSDHPDSVATTWKLSFQKVEQANAAAADLLRLCAFLSPDAIPEEIITERADDLGSNLQPVASDLVETDCLLARLYAILLGIGG